MQIAGVLLDVEPNFVYYSYEMLQLHGYVHGSVKGSFFSRNPFSFLWFSILHSLMHWKIFRMCND